MPNTHRSPSVLHAQHPHVTPRRAGARIAAFAGAGDNPALARAIAHAGMELAAAGHDLTDPATAELAARMARERLGIEDTEAAE